MRLDEKILNFLGVFSASGDDYATLAALDKNIFEKEGKGKKRPPPAKAAPKGGMGKGNGWIKDRITAKMNFFGFFQLLETIMQPWQLWIKAFLRRKARNGHHLRRQRPKAEWVRELIGR